jgi:hypothetical protein
MAAAAAAAPRFPEYVVPPVENRSPTQAMGDALRQYYGRIPRLREWHVIVASLKEMLNGIRANHAAGTIPGEKATELYRSCVKTYLFAEQTMKESRALFTYMQQNCNFASRGVLPKNQIAGTDSLEILHKAQHTVLEHLQQACVQAQTTTEFLEERVGKLRSDFQQNYESLNSGWAALRSSGEFKTLVETANLDQQTYTKIKVEVTNNPLQIAPPPKEVVEACQQLGINGNDLSTPISFGTPLAASN